MFDRPNEDYGDLIPLQEWVESVGINAFTPDDGHGYWANETHHKVHHQRYDVFNLKDIPKNATHVLWFNK